MEGSSGIIGIDRKPSIETEPRTLSIDQIHYAREAALYVMRTSSIEQAMTIFTQGLQAVDCGVTRQMIHRRRTMTLEKRRCSSSIRKMNKYRTPPPFAGNPPPLHSIADDLGVVLSLSRNPQTPSNSTATSGQMGPGEPDPSLVGHLRHSLRAPP
ncbi:hypothetical protein LWI29_028909 [Acer saccharum]|uniref:Uncharacterized protein n=1 Tax=Acer saccharum TaxID=4024 RepID=A0AA39TA86_ACESA|nr:hypothetical protein LWI29_028909 [Acer saccharum]